MRSDNVQFQKTNKIFTGSTKYHGIDGYLCDSIVYPGSFFKYLTKTVTKFRDLLSGMVFLLVNTALITT